jgi:hypothetical protein
MARPTFFEAPFEYRRFFAFFAILLILNCQNMRAGAAQVGVPRFA